MILSELIKEHSLAMQAEVALKNVDWYFDVGGVEGSRFNKGRVAMKEAQTVVKQLYQESPEKAQALWVTHCPYARPDGMPTWVLK